MEKKIQIQITALEEIKDEIKNVLFITYYSIKIKRMKIII